MRSLRLVIIITVLIFFMPCVSNAECLSLAFKPGAVFDLSFYKDLAINTYKSVGLKYSIELKPILPVTSDVECITRSQDLANRSS